MVRIVALTNGSPHAWIVVRAVVDRFGPITVLTEGKEPRRALLRRRIRRHGLLRAAGQVGFVLLQRIVARLSAPRIRDILRREGLETEPPPGCEILRVESVNGPACREALAQLRPEAVLVFGTRLLRRETLSVIPAPVLNLHSGITPKYRGQAGGYWALALGDPAHAGVTVHLVDEGVDTGGIVAQASITAEKRDTFSTYFYLQAAALRPLAVKALEDALAGRLSTFDPGLPSAQHYHPTLWGYLWTGFRRGVW